MAIYIDFDDVVCETSSALLALNEKLFGRKLRFEDMHDFDLHQSLKLTDSEYEPFIECFHRECLQGIPPIADAPATLLTWAQQGLGPTIVTGRPPWSYPNSRQWLDEHGLAQVPLYHLDKYRRFGDLPPMPYLLQPSDLPRFNFRLAIEDSPVSLPLLERYQVPYCLFSRPWNVALPTTRPRFASWSELARAVPTLLEKIRELSLDYENCFTASSATDSPHLG